MARNLPDGSVDVLALGDADLRADAIRVDVEGARAVIAGLAGAGVDFADVTATLEREGVESFAKSFHDALATVEQLLGGGLGTTGARLRLSSVQK